MFRRRRPGLIGTAARTAVIAGTATAVSGRVANRQQQNFDRQAEAQAAASAPPRADHGTDIVGRLQQLADLRTTGALSDQEFAAAKSKLLAS